jgi:hypothetical protein
VEIAMQQAHGGGGSCVPCAVEERNGKASGLLLQKATQTERETCSVPPPLAFFHLET